MSCSDQARSIAWYVRSAAALLLLASAWAPWNVLASTESLDGLRAVLTFVASLVDTLAEGLEVRMNLPANTELVRAALIVLAFFGAKRPTEREDENWIYFSLFLATLILLLVYSFFIAQSIVGYMGISNSTVRDFCDVFAWLFFGMPALVYAWKAMRSNAPFGHGVAHCGLFMIGIVAVHALDSFSGMNVL